MPKYTAAVAAQMKAKRSERIKRIKEATDLAQTRQKKIARRERARRIVNSGQFKFARTPFPGGKKFIVRSGGVLDISSHGLSQGMAQEHLLDLAKRLQAHARKNGRGITTRKVGGTPLGRDADRYRRDVRHHPDFVAAQNATTHPLVAAHPVDTAWSGADPYPLTRSGSPVVLPYHQEANARMAAFTQIPHRVHDVRVDGQDPSAY